MNTDLTIDYQDGAFYQGGFTTTDEGRKIPHGEGTCRFANGDLFAGDYKRGQPVKGTITNASRVWTGDIFVPEDRYPQSGAITFAGGTSKYTGAMQQGRAHGTGTREWFRTDGSCKARYTGEWAEGHFCNGTYKYENGATYKGRWKDQLPHDSSSHALFEYANGSCYEGPMEAGARHGEGRLVWLEHGKTTTLRATFDQDNASGDARISWLGGAQWFTGPLDAHHQPAGPGTYRFLNDNKEYCGDSAHRLPHGQGKMVWLSTGIEYNGQWKDGKQHGRGTLETPGYIYSGPWSRGNMHGVPGCEPEETGLYTWRVGGFKCQGFFSNGACPTVGKFTYPDESTHEGPLIYGFPAHDPQGIGQAPMPVPLDTSGIAIKRAHLRRTLDALVSHNGNTVTAAVLLECGHELDRSEVEFLARTTKQHTEFADHLMLSGKLGEAKKHRASAQQRYRCPCSGCGKPITMEPGQLPGVSQIASFLTWVHKNFRDNCMSDAEFLKKYDALVKEDIGFPTINNGRPA